MNDPQQAPYTDNDNPQKLLPKGAIVLVAKVPRPGSVKTRLSKLLGEDGCASFAKAMLCDILEEVGSCSRLSRVKKVLLFAPGDEEGRKSMSTVLSDINMSQEWTLLPMLSSADNTKRDLRSPDLTSKLKDALIRVRTILDEVEVEAAKDPQTSNDNSRGGGVLFLGMDSPEIDLDEIHGSLLAAAAASSNVGSYTTTNDDSNGDGTAHLCPANDGGYGMLCLPPSTPINVFDGVRWSTSLTAVSQLKALGDCGVSKIRVGRLMFDIDEPEDVWNLAHRLCRSRNGARICAEEVEEEEQSNDVLTSDSFSLPTMENSRRQDDGGVRTKHTWKQLVELDIVREEEVIGDHHQCGRRFVVSNQSSSRQ